MGLMEKFDGEIQVVRKDIHNIGSLPCYLSSP